MTEMTPAKYALNNIEQFTAAMDEMPDDYGKELQEPGNCEQCHEMLARIDEQRGHSLCSDCRWQKSRDTTTTSI